jgi:hypothetical protein
MKVARKFFFLAMAAMILPTTTTAVSSNDQGVSAQNQGESSSSGAQTQTSTEAEGRTQVQTQTNNPGIGTMTQAEVRARYEERIEEARPDYVPRSEKAREKMSEVAKVAEELIFLAEDFGDQSLGEIIREVARAQSENYDVINQNIDNAVKRTAFAKFFIGPNYGELKTMKQTMEENRNQVQKMEQVMTQIQNESEKIQLANQIITMQNLQLELQEQLGELTRGFSLFGWMNRWVRGY